MSAGVREHIRYLVQHRMVDVLCTTAGGIEEDFIKVTACSAADTDLGSYTLYCYVQGLHHGCLPTVNHLSLVTRLTLHHGVHSCSPPAVLATLLCMFSCAVTILQCSCKHDC